MPHIFIAEGNTQETCIWLLEITHVTLIYSWFINNHKRYSFNDDIEDCNFGNQILSHRSHSWFRCHSCVKKACARLAVMCSSLDEVSAASLSRIYLATKQTVLPWTAHEPSGQTSHVLTGTGFTHGSDLDCSITSSRPVVEL
jgi:hypothetical protein